MSVVSTLCINKEGYAIKNWVMKKTLIASVFVFLSALSNAEIFGTSTRAQLNSIAWGYGSAATAPYAMAGGYASQASGSYSLALGNAVLAANVAATAFGNRTQASGVYSTALGSATLASGNISTATGLFTIANARGSLVTGEFNVEFPDVSPSTLNALDPVFAIGNGSDTNNRSNAFTVLRNGLTSINGNLVVNGLISSISDFRLKSNVTPFESGENIVMALELYLYR